MRDVGVAPVKFQHVDTPVGERLCVQLVMVECARKSSASFAADIFVKSQLHAFRMHLLHQHSTELTRDVHTVVKSHVQ